MEIGLTILLFVCMTALLYVLLSLKITRQVDLQMKEFYKTRIHSDIQEFYREMEGYAALMENRIQRFKTLVERSEQTGRSSAILAEEETAQHFESAPAQQKKNSPVVAGKKRSEVVLPQKSKAVVTKENPTLKKKTSATTAAQPKKNEKNEPAKNAKPVVKAKIVEKPITPLPVQTIAYSERDAADAEDTAIAEELMKDLFAHDEMQLSKQVRPQKTEVTAPQVEMPDERTVIRQGAPQVANFFSRIGKAIEPVIFGEKNSVATAAKTTPAAAKPAAVTQPAQPPKQQDFAEVLRRAEQIKAEKQAERERAELEARAEFYTGGDTFSPAAPAGRTAQVQLSAVTAPAAAVLATPPQQVFSAAPRPQVRNSLAVKELDQHTVNFLIDSLVQDNGYRRQALRALTENNIPLEEIARLSRIDIGELQLMRQLGKF